MVLTVGDVCQAQATIPKVTGFLSADTGRRGGFIRCSTGTWVSTLHYRSNCASAELLLEPEVREATFPRAPLARDPVGTVKGSQGHLRLSSAKATPAGAEGGGRRVRSARFPVSPSLRLEDWWRVSPCGTALGGRPPAGRCALQALGPSARSLGPQAWGEGPRGLCSLSDFLKPCPRLRKESCY